MIQFFSWSTTYFPLQQYGLKLKFVDIDLETLNYDLKALKSAISDKTIPEARTPEYRNRT
jgi:dTDP-4-amino-4,6-dideoxygalactose transaminase